MIMMGDKKKMVTAILGKGADNVGTRPEIEGDEHGSELLACAEELISAIQGNDAQGVVDALQAAFEHMEMKPHKEAGEPMSGPITGHSY